GLESEALVKAAQQNAAASQEDAVARDVSSQLGRRLLERVLDRVDDFTQRARYRRPDLSATEADLRGQPREEVAAADLARLLGHQRNGGSDRDLDRLRGL